MKQNSLRRLAALLLALLLAGSFSVPALASHAIDPEHPGSISMSCSYKGKPVSGGDLCLYRVAEPEREDGSWYFRLRSDLLDGQRLDQQALDDAGLAGRPAAAPSLGTPDKTAGFNTKGKVQFKDLRPGLYLLVQSKAASGYEKMLPVLVSLPWFDEASGSYLYDIDATVKPAVERIAVPTSRPTPTPKPGPWLPQTGQLNWPVPVLAGLGLCLLLTGTALLVSDRPQRKRRARRE